MACLAILFTFAGIGTSCLPPDSEPKKLGQALTVDADRTESFKGAKVRELFVVIFPKDYSVEEWKAIFDSTNVLSRNKRLLRQIEGQDTLEIQEQRAVLIGENASILGELGAKSLFMMSWTVQDENCKISKALKIVCRPFNPENPMNGGLPVQSDPLQFVVPDPIQSEIKTPYVSIALEQRDESKGPLYGLELRLKPESEDQTASWFKGDVRILPNSRFRSQQDGSEVGQYYPYGYAEMVLGH